MMALNMSILQIQTLPKLKQYEFSIKHIQNSGQVQFALDSFQQ